MGRVSEGPKAREYLNEGLTAAERFSRMTEDLEERCRCIRTCALCCKLLGQPEQAREWLMKLPSVWSGIELCALEILDGGELRDHLQCALSDFLDVLQKLIFASSVGLDLQADERRAILEKLPRLLELLFEEGDYGLFAVPLAKAYAALAGEAASPEERERLAGKALAAAETFDGLGDGRHRSLLFRGMAYSASDATKTDPLPFKERIMQQLTESGFAGV